MSTSPTFEQFLITTTGLPRDQVRALYQAGFPWPLCSVFDVRMAGLLAQAEGLLFPAALAKAEAATAEHLDVYLDTVRRHRPEDAPTVHPLFHHIEGHVTRIATKTATSCRTVFHLMLAIQTYAMERPGWELHHMCIGQRPS